MRRFGAVVSVIECTKVLSLWKALGSQPHIAFIENYTS
jgi:hypothetical protein